MKIVTAIAVAAIAIVTLVACYRTDVAYKQGYSDGIQRAREIIHQIMEERKDQGMPPQALIPYYQTKDV